MRVVINAVFVKSDRVGGGWSYTYNLLKSLSNMQASAEIIVLVAEQTQHAFKGIELEKEVVHLDSRSSAKRVCWEQVGLPRLLKKLGPDVFHGIGNVLPLRLDCTCVVTLHDLQFLHFPENFDALHRFFFSHGIPRSLRKAGRTICVSQATKNDAVRAFNIKPEKLEVIYEGGLVEGEVDSMTSRQGLTARYGITGPFLLSVGSAFPHKNLRRLFQAFAAIASQVPHDLYVVGEPFHFRQWLADTARDSLPHHPKRVKTLGFIPREDLVGLYHLADAFVFPSLFEGFGIPAVEAMQCGCPVICSNSSSLPEIVQGAGEYFDPLDAEQMAAAMRKVCVDADLRTAMRERGFQRARVFSWERMGSDTWNVYCEVAGNTTTEEHLVTHG